MKKAKYKGRLSSSSCKHCHKVMVPLFERDGWLLAYPFRLKWGLYCPVCEYRVYKGVVCGESEEEIALKIWYELNGVSEDDRFVRNKQP